jgi:hypothetical protein
MILQEVVDLIDVAKNSVGMDYSSIRMCELGDQRMKWNAFGTGKNYFKDKGILEHVSIDLNGKNGALRIDLTKPVTQWSEYFDILTDYGTIEHVNNQYAVFKNVHDIVKIGGAIVHTLPEIGYFKTHCDYHYDMNFFKDLSLKNGYDIKILESRVIHGRRGRTENLVCCVLIKKSNGFISEAEFGQIRGLYYK